MLNPADMLRLRGAKSYPRAFKGAVPAAGAEVSVTVPSAEVWELYSLEVTLVASGAPANRLPRLVVDDGTTEIGRWLTTTALTASTTTLITWSVGSALTGAPTTGLTIPLPAVPLLLVPGWRIRTVTGNIDGTDAYGAPTAYVLVTTARIGRPEEPTLAEQAGLPERVLAGVS